MTEREIEELKEFVDSLVVIPNDKLFQNFLIKL